MSDDIVKELRESKIALHSTAHKAADEIEKLREELDACDEKTKELCDEITCIHAEFATVTAERDRMREALKDALVWLGDPHGGRPVMSVDSIRNIANRAALEGVTEKSGAGNE